MKKIIVGLLFLSSFAVSAQDEYPQINITGKSKAGVASCVGQAAGKYLKTQGFDNLELKIKKAYRSENFKRFRAIFANGYVDNYSTTRIFNHDQLAYKMNTQEMIKGYTRSDDYFDVHEREVFIKLNTVSPVFFDFILKTSEGIMKWKGTTNLTSLKRIHSLKNEVTFECSLKNLVIEHI